MSRIDRPRAWDLAPSGLLVLDHHGTILDANSTFLRWVGQELPAVIGRARLSQLLSVGGRIYWETHVSPLLHAGAGVEEVALELVTGDGRLPVLMTAVVHEGAAGTAPVVLVTLSGARERARYERELLAARQDAEQASTRLEVLQRFTAALSGAVGVTGVTEALLAQTTAVPGVSAAALWLLRDGDLSPYAAVGEPLGLAPQPAVRASEREVRADGDRLVVPLHGQTALRGVLSLLARSDPAAEPLDRDVLTAVGQQAGLALDRAALYEEKSTLAHRLQQALLDVQPPADPRFAVTTAYRPGVASLEVGGDWYDVFLVDDDVLVVVVGDVVGRGLAAAGAMGQLRSAIRALAEPGSGPAAVLTRLDRFVQLVEAAASATLAYVAVRLSTGQVRYACAGHLPPVLLRADGEPELLWDGRSAPLGVRSDEPRTEAELSLRPGDQLLLYTDGLIERRRRSLRTGLELLRSASASALQDPPDRAVPELTERMLADEQVHDDVCVLLLSWLGGAASRGRSPVSG